MRGLTVRQPWAWAIVHGGKDVENRTRNVAGRYRGPLAIHAGLRVDEQAFYDDLIQDAFGRYDDSWVLTEQVEQHGAFIGLVDLVDAHPARMLDDESGCCNPWGEQDHETVTTNDRRLTRRVATIAHLVLANPRPLERPIPCAGKLGLWTPPAEVLDELRGAL